MGQFSHDDASNRVFPLAVRIHMLELDSLNFELEGLMGAHLEALPSVAMQTDVTHCEDPGLSVNDLLPSFLLEWNHKSRLFHLDRHLVVLEVFVKVSRNLFDL